MQPNWNEERARHWHLFTPPARPSAGDTAIYAEEILASRAAGSPAWIILGCTPELRALAAGAGAEAICIDWNEDVYRVLGEALDAPRRERLIHSDWVEAEIPFSVELLLADGSLNMLPTQRHQAFVEKIAGALSPGGTVLIRVHVATPARFESAEQVFAAIRGRAVPEGVFSATRTDLDMLWLDPDTLTVTFEDYHQRLRALHGEGLITDEEYAAYDVVLPWNRIRLHYTTSEAFERLVRPYFHVVRSRTPDDYAGSANHPVYTLTKR